MDSPQQTSPFSALLDELRAEWDIAEAEIKRAEQVNSDVIIPAVNELRYAGRRLADVLALAHDPVNHDKMLALCGDAKFFCNRARHDAIDASVDLMVQNLETMLTTIGPSIVTRCFPKLTEYRYTLFEVQEKTVESRKDRENRNLIYKVVSETSFAELVRLHSALTLSEPLMLAIVEQEEKEKKKNEAYGRNGIIIGVIGGVIGVIGAALAVFAWIYPDYWKHENLMASPPAITSPSHQSQTPQNHKGNILPPVNKPPNG